MPPDDVLTFACPRCRRDVAEAFYGPCGACRDALRETQGQAPGGQHLDVGYEPKMNVTPNAVATRD